MAVAAVPLTAEHAEVACEVARGVVDDALARVLHAPCPARARQARRRAWVTLLTNEAYAKGVEALARSLVAAESRYPLVAMLGGGVPAHVRASLAAEGVECRDVRPLPLPSGEGSAPCYACEHFAACWAKLRMWEWEEEFEQLVYLDADMIVVRGIDELLDDDLGDCPLRAVQECFCPVKERAHLCPYRRSASSAHPPPNLPSGAARYFNAGLLVLRPRRATAAHFGVALRRCDLGAFPFAEQDFLNGYFGRSWRPLPWPFNASKALFACHRSDVWDYSSVRVIHFTMAKPWDMRHPCHAGYHKLNTLWYAAHADARTIPRTLLALVLEERRGRRAQSAAATANAVRELEEPGGGAEAESPRSGGAGAEPERGGYV